MNLQKNMKINRLTCINELKSYRFFSQHWSSNKYSFISFTKNPQGVYDPETKLYLFLISIDDPKTLLSIPHSVID